MVEQISYCYAVSETGRERLFLAKSRIDIVASVYTHRKSAPGRGAKWGWLRGWLIALLLAASAGGAVARSSRESKSGTAVSQVPVKDKQNGDKQNGDKQNGENAARQTSPGSEKARPHDQRQAQVIADTSRLLQLARELKLEVSKSNKDILSIAVVEKADEIEKLAKSLKDRMKTE